MDSSRNKKESGRRKLKHHSRLNRAKRIRKSLDFKDTSLLSTEDTNYKAKHKNVGLLGSRLSKQSHNGNNSFRTKMIALAYDYKMFKAFKRKRKLSNDYDDREQLPAIK